MKCARNNTLGGRLSLGCGKYPGRWISGILVLLASAFFLSACHHQSFARDHVAKAIHIFGIGWISEKGRTNTTRAFAIGNLDSVQYSTTVNTGAPMTITTGRRNTNTTPTNQIWTTAPPPQNNPPDLPPSRP